MVIRAKGMLAMRMDLFSDRWWIRISREIPVKTSIYGLLHPCFLQMTNSDR